MASLQFDLPKSLIAQSPAEPRDHARLWVESLGEETAGRTGQDALVRDLPNLLEEGDLLISNDTRVLPARLYGRRASGARVELLFLEPSLAPDAPLGSWLAMVRPAKKPKPGERLSLSGGLQVEMLRRQVDGNGDPGAYWEVRIEGGEQSVEEVLEAAGEMPLPPYIERPEEGDPLDRLRYQTIFAERSGAVAAPTAGLHFTPRVLEGLAARGVGMATVTLHVGLGTFLPMPDGDPDKHTMHEERFEVRPEVVHKVQETRRAGGRVIAVGTTSARALEAASAGGELRACAGRTDLFIRPGYRFRVVDGLLTNFHLPGSTLLLLVAALVGEGRLMGIYSRAIADRWRFYSYGDAMLLANFRVVSEP